MQIRGTLKKAQRVSIPAGGFSLRGTIHGDAKGHYRDGWFIYIAKVIEEIQPNVFKTATGNIYRIEQWAPYEQIAADGHSIPKTCEGMGHRIKHGMRRHPVYAVYSAMVQRCCNPNNKSYHRYGGRGITICDRWRHGEDGLSGFECFFADMGDRPTRKHSLEREKNDQGYHPNNCKWATRKEQQSNIRSNRKVLFEGTEMTLSELSRRSGIHFDTLKYRIFKKGWPVARAVTAPLLSGVNQQ
jgi:hypothetical protein